MSWSIYLLIEYILPTLEVLEDVDVEEEENIES